MRSRWRISNIARWTSTILAALVLAMWLFSCLWKAQLWLNGPVPREIPLNVITLDHGCVRAFIEDLGSVRSLELTVKGAERRWIWLPGATMVRGITYARAFYADLPLWIPFALLLLPELIAWHARVGARRRAAAGLCPACRYPLGNLAPGAACPECGAKTAAAA